MIFGTMMAAVMVLGMESYNLLLEAGGWHSGILRHLAREAVPMTLIVLSLQSFVAARIVHAVLVRRRRNSETPRNRRRERLGMQLCTIAVMCPLMSLIAMLLFKSPSTGVYFATLLRNLPMALCWQLLVAGPLVRFLYANIFPAAS